MPPELTDDAIPGSEPEGSPAGTEPAIEPTTVLPSEAVRSSPEYIALQAQLRTEARARGTAEREAARARTAAETARIEAETREAEAMQSQIVDLLGESGLATWQEFADLSQTNPIAAAKKWAELTGMLDAAKSTSTEEPGVTQPQQPVRPVVARSLDAGAPLTSIAGPDPDQERITLLETEFTNAVEKNRTHANRMTERERRTGIIGYAEAAYRKFFQAQRGGTG